MTQHFTTSPQNTDRDAHIRDAQNAVIARMKSDPSKARSTVKTNGHISEGLACHVTQGRFEMMLDMGRAMGGECAGLSPGFHGRAAIAACVAMAVKMLAARESVRFEAVDVSVEMDFDDAALFGLGSGHAAPLDTRIAIDVTTDAADSTVRGIVDQALAWDIWYLALRDPQQVSTRLSVHEPGRVPGGRRAQHGKKHQ
ncbi:OsmC family protein [Pacificibacter marinus]|uniref:OsmC family protein n=1 Tax=Pacificibacter marinus TaxID=658057 RepID=UPI001C06F138|nr:OsmC family protein [Pacificibacter marinus]MBU2868035.1 OsmC family protein [Pacificibacter marinus]